MLAISRNLVLADSAVRSGVCFFFSSRRRHTRLQGDWSSDVCSSDLRCIQDGSVCANASGQTGATYVLGAADVGAAIRVSVTATNAGGSAGAGSAIDRKSVV